MYTWRKRLAFFLIMSVKAWGGDMLKLKDMSAKSVRFFGRLPKFKILNCAYRRKSVSTEKPMLPKKKKKYFFICRKYNCLVLIDLSSIVNRKILLAQKYIDIIFTFLFLYIYFCYNEYSAVSLSPNNWTDDDIKGYHFV